MGMFLVQFKLSNKGKEYEDKRAYVNEETLDFLLYETVFQMHYLFI